jgi:quinol monooxygenase YgiN
VVAPPIVRGVPFTILAKRKERISMFTRMVEVYSESGKARELCNTIDERALPILKKQAGFVDETVMVSDADPNLILAISNWNRREDAERYALELDTVQKTIQHLLETDPTVRTFDVHTACRPR